MDVDDFGAVGTLQSSTTHSISLEFDDATFDAMITTYTTTQEKDWIEATVTIDGVTYEQAGIRLKGNSSLRSIAGGGLGGPGGLADATTDVGDAESPETLPWLVKLDKFVDDQNHEGLTDLVVRSNSSSTSLNEALALELLGLAGLASQDAIAAGFSVNGSTPVLRLVIDNPDDEWMAEELDATGALYKAEAGGDYSYRGDDPEAYTDVFDQEAGKDNTDLAPLTEFLDFINNSDDATFEAELADRLDVDKFATYLAMQDLLGNFDDIDGPGNNSYLFYDTESGQFTVVPWDYNLAFGQMPGGAGAGRPGGGQPRSDGEMPTPAGDLPDMPTDFPADFPGDFPSGMPSGDFPAGEFPTGDFQGPGGRGGGMMGGGNILVERFLAVDAWQELYQTRLAELQVSLIDSGLATNVLAAWAEIVSTTGLVDETTVAEEVARLSSQFS
ncbi:MAG TPA: CotH kinase family protein [Ilumatobacter sp.]|nr:CotH kinase family protein [Ilumatobacter sp.]